MPTEIDPEFAEAVDKATPAQLRAALRAVARIEFPETRQTGDALALLNDGWTTAYHRACNVAFDELDRTPDEASSTTTHTLTSATSELYGYGAELDTIVADLLADDATAEARYERYDRLSATMRGLLPLNEKLIPVLAAFAETLPREERPDHDRANV
ncbi:hypothetical protein JNUCC0626_18505 [Lentzea sp. JNUCC 0626]|uniref:hypothetical protein n=1 Tax=Lentzea sp. JNUCC 0626 TaxID=3367513 RepID=UPI0037496973